ncbi:MAG: hypothetical protein AAGU21_22030 [Solidesulfovibrio sp.]|uniref:hypothetical protein n=1 Tax=Solidesulfovibrio sp. TaxID=2910990 RepID=UPI00315984F3
MSDYKYFQSLCCSELPLNRKEKFYTGTVFPSLLFHNGIENLKMFISNIDGFNGIDLKELTGDDVLFYTEYNFKQSCILTEDITHSNFKTNDTPDVVVEILKPTKCFIVIESKMFMKTTQAVFDSQMKRQREYIIDYLPSGLGVSRDKCFHVALIPERLGYEKSNDYSLFFWDDFLDENVYSFKANYFYKYLRFAMENYETLSFKNTAFFNSVRGAVSGKTIREDMLKGKRYYIGREGGERIIDADIDSGIFESRTYWYNDVIPHRAKKGNWLRIDLLKRIATPKTY